MESRWAHVAPRIFEVPGLEVYELATNDADSQSALRWF